MLSRTLLTAFCFVLLLPCSSAQIISQFSWDSNPPSNADVGPNAISISSSATSSTGGVGGTNGLNAGLPKLDVDMVLADSSIFDVDGIEISFDYQRDESQGTFFRRGSSLVIDGTNNLSVSYRVDDGLGGFTTVSSGNVYAIPNDNTFRNYRFYYLPGTGFGALYVDATEVWSNDGPDNRNLYWTGAGNLEIGVAMDGSGSNQVFFDNFIIAEITNAPLPIELLYFEAEAAANNTVGLSWETASEINNDYFTIERAADARNWEEIAQIDGAGNSHSRLTYSTVDDRPLAGTNYYRLKQTDYNGDFVYSDIEAVNLGEPERLKLYPNPTKQLLTVEGNPYELQELQLLNIHGQVMPLYIEANPDNTNRLQLDLSQLKTGIYLLHTRNGVEKVVKW